MYFQAFPLYLPVSLSLQRIDIGFESFRCWHEAYKIELWHQTAHEEPIIRLLMVV